MNLVSAFAEAVHKSPEKIAVFWGDREYSYRSLWQESKGLGRTLMEDFQVRSGDRVGLWLKNCPEFVPALFGILDSGGVVVPINNFFKADEVKYILEDGEIDLMISSEELASHFPVLQQARPSLQIWNTESLSRPNNGVSTEPKARTIAGETDLAVLIYTSGTTGRPKGAMLSHGNLLHN